MSLYYARFSKWYRIWAMKFTVILEPESDGGYSVVCPAVPGCVSQGHDLPTAVSNIREAILLCLEVRRADGLAPVAETPELIAREIQECLEDRAAEGLPLTIETRQVDVEVEVAA
jgi:predicted RNase H-like HicB family nuclease